jgi:DNA-binding FadR family transcriptional regulator
LRLDVPKVRPAYRQIADELRQQIMRGAVTPGQRLPAEADLAHAFGVSRSTVREALRLMASQHLVVTLRGVQGGSFVAAPEPDQVAAQLSGALGALAATPRLGLADLFEGRLLLEPAAARLAAERADAQAVGAIQAAAGVPHDPSAPADLSIGLGFHRAVLAATGNLLLPLMGWPLADVMATRVDESAVTREQWRHIDAQHRAIGTHIANGEGAAAEHAMREHLAELRTLFAAY